MAINYQKFFCSSRPAVIINFPFSILNSKKALPPKIFSLLTCHLSLELKWQTLFSKNANLAGIIIPLTIFFVYLPMEMSNKEYINSFSPNLFWDANLSELKMDESRGYIIQRVLEYGQMNDWLLINRYYGLDQIVEECKKMRSLNPVCLAFICTISHTKEEEYRCYHYRQSCPTPWNSWKLSCECLSWWICDW